MCCTSRWPRPGFTSGNMGGADLRCGKSMCQKVAPSGRASGIGAKADRRKLSPEARDRPRVLSDTSIVACRASAAASAGSESASGKSSALARSSAVVGRHWQYPAGRRSARHRGCHAGWWPVPPRLARGDTATAGQKTGWPALIPLSGTPIRTPAPAPGRLVLPRKETGKGLAGLRWRCAGGQHLRRAAVGLRRKGGRAGTAAHRRQARPRPRRPRREGQVRVRGKAKPAFWRLGNCAIRDTVSPLNSGKALACRGWRNALRCLHRHGLAPGGETGRTGKGTKAEGRA